MLRQLTGRSKKGKGGSPSNDEKKEQDAKPDKLPGSWGSIPIVGDTWNFGKNPLEYVTAKMKEYSATTFKTSILNLSTAIACSYRGFKELTEDKLRVFSHNGGYAHLFENAYGRSHLTSDEDDVYAQYDRVFGKALGHRSVAGYIACMMDACDHWLGELAQQGGDKGVDGLTVSLYTEFKKVAFYINMAVMLGIPMSSPMLPHLIEWGTVSFRGAVSLPVNIKIGWSQSSFSKGQAAHKRIRHFVRRRLKTAIENVQAKLASQQGAPPPPPPSVPDTPVSSDPPPPPVQPSPSTKDSNHTTSDSHTASATPRKNSSTSSSTDSKPPRLHEVNDHCYIHRVAQAVMEDMKEFTTEEKELHLQVGIRELSLMVTGLLPKVHSSVWASACLELAQPKNHAWRPVLRREAEQFIERYEALRKDSVPPTDAKWKEVLAFLQSLPHIDHFLQEVLRLHPPLFGGCRASTKKTVLDGYVIPKGYKTWFCIPKANTDPVVYDRPHEFLPERWQRDTTGSKPPSPLEHDDTNAESKNATVPSFMSAPNLSTSSKTDCSTGNSSGSGAAPVGRCPVMHASFGGGRHPCKGKLLATVELKVVFCRVLTSLSWEVLPDQNMNYRYLPVCRVNDGLNVKLSSSPFA